MLRCINTTLYLTGCVVAVAAVLFVSFIVVTHKAGTNPFTEQGRTNALLQRMKQASYNYLNTPPTTGTTPEVSLVVPPKWVQRVALHFLRFLENLKAAIVPAEVRLVEKVVGVWTSKALYAAVKLRIPDALPVVPVGGNEVWPTATEIAEKIGVQNEETLYRFLRMLGALGILRERPGRRFAHTEYSLLLTTDPKYQGFASGRASVLAWGHQSLAWDYFAQQLLTGENAFKQYSGGEDLWEYYDDHRDEEQHFQRMLAELSAVMSPALVKPFNWAAKVGGKNATATIVDVGGGMGGVLALVLQELPQAKGILLDLESVIAQAKVAPHWKDSLLARVEFVPGSFLKKVPQGDLYIMRSILHDWDDETAIKILKNVRKAIEPDGTLLLIEQLLPPEGQVSQQIGIPVEVVDMHMMVMLDGKERTQLQYQHLLKAANFQLRTVYSTRTVFYYLEAVPM